MKIINKIFVLGLFLLSFSVFAESSPTEIVQKTVDQFVNALNDNRTAIKRDPMVARQLVKRIVLPLVDVTTMGRSVVGRMYWDKASSAQKQRFIDAFTSLVIRTYDRAFTDYVYKKIEVYPVRGGFEGKNRILLNSTVFRNSMPPVDLSYRLILKNQGWKIYDLSVEGISLVQSYRSQFIRPLEKGGLENLIREISVSKRIS